MAIPSEMEITLGQESGPMPTFPILGRFIDRYDPKNVATNALLGACIGVSVLGLGLVIGATAVGLQHLDNLKVIDIPTSQRFLINTIKLGAPLLGFAGAVAGLALRPLK